MRPKGGSSADEAVVRQYHQMGYVRRAGRRGARTKTRGNRPGYTYLHPAIDGFSCLAYTEALLDCQSGQ